MKKVIIDKLKEIEHNENVKILLAVESGSRAWGFASPDSDYDVRFIYVRPKEFYLKLEKTRDVIELPINDELDINGWDLCKALRLLHSSNPTLFEWLSSPVKYIETDFYSKYKDIILDYFSPKKSLYHYVNMADNNFKLLKGTTVKAKKYFYALRPVLACRWILDYGKQPPMSFYELMNDKLPEEYKPLVNNLLDIKINSPEIKEIERVDTLNHYIDYSIGDVKNILGSMYEKNEKSWKTLNEILLTEAL